MARSSNREKLLSEGLRLVHQRGFGASSVRDIVQAAGVPQGSFTNHFVSKEAFGLEVLARYREEAAGCVARTLGNAELRPLDRLRAWLTARVEELKSGEMRKGCLYGNLGAEACEHSEAMRERLVEVFAEQAAALETCLAAAVEAGELRAGTEVKELAAFIVSSYQGAVLVAKVERDASAVERFVHVLFGCVLDCGV